MHPPHLLVINPNTTGSITDLLCRHVQFIVGASVQVVAVTARSGAPYIADEATFAQAEQAAPGEFRHALKQAPAPRSVLIGCFGDPGLEALRAETLIPVTGLAEASFTEASKLGRFAIVTGGAAWDPMLRRLAGQLGYGEALAGVVTVAPTGAQLAADREAAVALLAEACAEAAALPRVRSVILGGAGLAGLAALVQPEVPVPVLDSVEAGARRALALLTADTAPIPPAAPASGVTARLP